MAFQLFSKKYFRAGAETDCGLKRSENQDAYRCLPARGLFIITASSTAILKSNLP